MDGQSIFELVKSTPVYHGTNTLAPCAIDKPGLRRWLNIDAQMLSRLNHSMLSLGMSDYDYLSLQGSFNSIIHKRESYGVWLTYRYEQAVHYANISPELRYKTIMIYSKYTEAIKRLD